MGFDYDAFISYSHIDNVGLVDGSKGWITNLHRALEVRIGQLLGEKPQIWRDPKLSGNDVFEITLVEQLQRVAVLVTVVSPRYIKSEWTRRELVEFWKAAQLQGGVTFHDKARIFKVLKTPIPNEMNPPELAPLLGYEFFKIDGETGRVRELDEVFGAQAQRDFWMKLDDLAHDITALLEMLRREFLVDVAGVPDKKEAVFLAETTLDLREQREAIRRDLQQHGYTVLPSRGLPLIASEMKTSFEEDLAQCRMSIHLIGKNYGLVPEGSDLSLTEIQNELAIERGKRGGFMRLLWVPSGIQIEDERQAKVVDELRKEPVLQGEADLLETFFEDLRTVIYDRLKEVPPLQSAAKKNEEPVNQNGLRQIYLIYDQRDAAAASLYADTLFDQGFEVLHPTIHGDEAEVRLCHEENLRICDGVLIFFGSTNEAWVRRKLREIQKSVGYGRTGPLPEIAISCLSPMTDEKQRFRIHNTPVINHMNEFSADLLIPFVSRLRS